MLLIIENKLQKLGIFLDNTLLKKPLFFHFFCAFFDITSRLTNFLVFDRFGNPLFLFLIGLSLNNYSSVLNNFLLNIKIFGFSKISYIFFSMPAGFPFCVLFFFIFYQLVFINTILAYSKKIAFFMKNQ